MQGEVVELRDPDCVVREASLDQDRAVDAASDAHVDAFRNDLDAGRGLDEVARKRVGLNRMNTKSTCRLVWYHSSTASSAQLRPCTAVNSMPYLVRSSVAGLT